MPPEEIRSFLRFFFSPQSRRAMRRRERRTQSDKSTASSRLPAHKGYETDLQPHRWGWREGEAHKKGGRGRNNGVMSGRWFSPIAVNFAKNITWFILFYFQGETQLFFFPSSGQKERKWQEEIYTVFIRQGLRMEIRAEHPPLSVLRLFFFSFHDHSV